MAVLSLSKKLTVRQKQTVSIQGSMGTYILLPGSMGEAWGRTFCFLIHTATADCKNTQDERNRFAMALKSLATLIMLLCKHNSNIPQCRN